MYIKPEALGELITPVLPAVKMHYDLVMLQLLWCFLLIYSS